MDPTVAKQLEDFRKSVAITAEEILFNVFPAKILSLQALVASTSSSSSPFHTSHADASTDATVYPGLDEKSDVDSKKRRRVDAVDNMALDAPRNNSTYARIPAAMVANKHLIAVHELLKKECEDLIGLCDKVKLWVNLTMPKIEDGDNFGVQIQEEALSELHRSQESAYALRDAGRQHHLNRAKICSKIMKYPFLEDYTIALREHDERQLYLATQNLSDLRNVYAVLTDILHKNIAKIRAPKANNGLSLY